MPEATVAGRCIGTPAGAAVDRCPEGIAATVPVLRVGPACAGGESGDDGTGSVAAGFWTASTGGDFDPSFCTADGSPGFTTPAPATGRGAVPPSSGTPRQSRKNAISATTKATVARSAPTRSFIEMLRTTAYAMKPRYPPAYEPGNRVRFGKTVVISVPLRPNHFASVAEY